MKTNRKHFEGIQGTEEIQNLIDDVYSFLPAGATGTTQIDFDTPVSDHVIEIIDVVCEAKRPLTVYDASLILQEYIDKRNGLESGTCPPVTVPVLRAVETIIENSSNEVSAYGTRLRTSLRNCKGLAFSSLRGACEGSQNGRDSLTGAQVKFRQRMARLRLNHEESKYSKLTDNLGMNPVLDDVTTKSMTYAASIGLNMIVAPLSFGCFMYFFAGSLLDYFWKREIDERMSRHMANQPDIRKVIAGVVSGVLMMIIEMLLFVIRTHEIDRATRSKSKKRIGTQPFGHYSSNTEKRFVAYPSRNRRY